MATSSLNQSAFIHAKHARQTIPHTVSHVGLTRAHRTWWLIARKVYASKGVILATLQMVMPTRCACHVTPHVKHALTMGKLETNPDASPVQTAISINTHLHSLAIRTAHLLAFTNLPPSYVDYAQLIALHVRTYQRHAHHVAWKMPRISTY